MDILAFDGSSYRVGWIKPGEYLRYTVQVTEDGTEHKHTTDCDLVQSSTFRYSTWCTFLFTVYRNPKLTDDSIAAAVWKPPLSPTGPVVHPYLDSRQAHVPESLFALRARIGVFVSGISI